MSISPSPIDTVPTIRYAVIYLRVSTARQATTGGSEEGFSIPAQREVTTRTAHGLGAYVVKEFVDAGASGTSIDRPALQKMLSYVAENSVDYVVVHEVDRLARNRAHDSTITTAIAEAGAKLVSASESIDESPSGELVHGIMASIAEFYSRNLSTEVLKGMSRKHQEGGTPSRAPIGYLNVKQLDANGREYRTVALDEARAPTIRWAFHTYASGKVSLRELTYSLNLLGLTASRSTGGSGGTISISMVQRILRNSYYVGVVTWRGVEAPGNHEPLGETRVWQQVQDRLTANRNYQGARQRHPHHLAGILKCGQCGWRMCITHSRSRSGKIYPYFFCGGRSKKRTDCTMPATSIAAVNAAIENLYRRLTITPQQSQHMQEQLRCECQGATVREPRTPPLLDYDELAAKRQKILDAYYQDAITLQTLQAELERFSAIVSAQDKNAVRMKEDAEIDQSINQIQLREDAHSSFKRSNCEERFAMHRYLFGIIQLMRTEDGQISLKPATDYALAYRSEAVLG